MSSIRFARIHPGSLVAVLSIVLLEGGCSLLNRPPGQQPQQAYDTRRAHDASTSRYAAPTAAPADANDAATIAAGGGGERQQREVEELVSQALTAPRLDQRTIAALRASDRAVAGVTDTLGAIDAAEMILIGNLRNAQTTGYKSVRPSANDTRAVTLLLDMEQGTLENTGRNLDIGIQGAGFFAVNNRPPATGGRVLYTRNGNVFVNKDGELVLGVGDGYKLIPPIRIPSNVTDISISQDGRIDVVRAGVKTSVGQLSLSSFLDSTKLQHVAGSLYCETAESGPATENKPGDGGSGQLLQGFLEASNVDLMRERVRLRFLQNWRQMLLRAIDGEPAAPAPARADIGGRE